MKTKIVTSIYSDLYGTEFGGRPNRGGHYRYSLLSLMKMSDADYVCFTSEREYDDLCKFFYSENKIDPIKLTIKIYDISNFVLSDKINKLKNIEETKKSDRCVEIQYCKFLWSLNESFIGNYDNIFWFDAGLSHAGLFPEKHMKQDGYYNQNFNCLLFDNQLLTNLLSFTGDKIFICSKENQVNYWSGTVPAKYYNEHCQDRHIIGGFFGGNLSKMKDYCELFLEYVNKLLENEPKLYHEENIMSLIYYNHRDLFKVKEFDNWWHENERISGLDMQEFLKTRKSFYKILEELRAII
jgi:hypothetical protein